MVHHLEFSGDRAGDVCGHWLWRKERSRGHTEHRKLGCLLRLCNPVVRSSERSVRTLCQGSKDACQHSPGASSLELKTKHQECSGPAPTFKTAFHGYRIFPCRVWVFEKEGHAPRAQSPNIRGRTHCGRRRKWRRQEHARETHGQAL